MIGTSGSSIMGTEASEAEPGCGSSVQAQRISPCWHCFLASVLTKERLANILLFKFSCLYVHWTRQYKALDCFTVLSHLGGLHPTGHSTLQRTEQQLCLFRSCSGTEGIYAVSGGEQQSFVTGYWSRLRVVENAHIKHGTS